jgi:hypothetical protein
LTFGDLYRTAIVCRAAGRPYGPVDRASLVRFVALRCGAGGASLPAAELPAEARRWLERWAGELEVEVARLDPARLDLRFVGGLWLSREWS